MRSRLRAPGVLVCGWHSLQADPRDPAVDGTYAWFASPDSRTETVVWIQRRLTSNSCLLPPQSAGSLDFVIRLLVSKNELEVRSLAVQCHSLMFSKLWFTLETGVGRICLGLGSFPLNRHLPARCRKHRQRQPAPIVIRIVEFRVT